MIVLRRMLDCAHANCGYVGSMIIGVLMEKIGRWSIKRKFIDEFGIETVGVG